MKKLMMTVLVAGMAAAAWADAHISYSGQLRAANGEQLTGKTTGNIEFRLYDVPTGTRTPLWARDIAVQIDANGCFAVDLHDSAGSEVQGNKPTAKVSLDDIIANNANLYLGLTVKGSSGEINPRQKLLSTPRAVFAENVSLAKGNFTVTGLATLSGGIAAGDKNEAFTVSKDGNVFAKGTLNVGKQATFTQGATFNKGVTFSQGISVSGGTYGVMPIGTIVMWWGDPKNIPEGWAICDGTKYDKVETPDLRGRFIVGVNPDNKNGREAYAFKASGGAEKIQLTTAQLPVHDHRYMGDDDPKGTGLARDPQKCNVPSDKSTFNYSGDPERSHDQSHTYATSTTGANQSHENRPPYYALYYIMRVK